ncbi:MULTISPECIES: transposase [Pseudoalteromonas]|uniref:Transposase n=1 Tax=Pseudoalteromonas tetraodonis TaxID=43659 RepID=A0ABD4ESF9_9GAMM|nr:MULTISPECIES: transposase [Pseudoalteromonas]KYL36122.1 transposase [Pseudoalteromonas spiralis]MDN3394327.1 transposase [Pseudoalteromonas sp. APC 3215]MDN3400302.1 transposase [Pseudoalteromonas sp. APC 3213]MDN3429571.1 transposase [Pseudoalteromonas sp. APC 3907]MDN3465074.1 transposase [Pseudoalteromonas sp. APC 3495]
MSALHLADILNSNLENYRQHHTMSYQQLRVCQHLQSCRTGQLGYQAWQCDNCGESQKIGCSCRDRHCPRCQGMATAKWVQRQQEDLLPCRYFHLVFTLPHELNIIAHYNPSALYQCLFKAAWQNLSQHIHLHCLIPAGALDKAHWHEIEKGYLYPVKALSTVFRGKMLAALNECDSSFEKINMPTKWCVYSKACLTYSEKLVSYLARYTRKGVMSESRLVSANEQSVSFKYHDYADNNRDKVMTLSCDEFLRRYLQHVLPKGFMRIRHYGFLANACRKRKLALIRSQESHIGKVEKLKTENVTLIPHWPCQHCKAGIMRLIGVFQLYETRTKVGRTS